MPITDADLVHLRRCVVLAEEALDAGNEPFGSLIVDAEGRVLREERNAVGGGDPTRHPEFELARWASVSLTPEQRAASTVYTSGEHCPMCSAAHGWAGLGRIAYASSSAELTACLADCGYGDAPVTTVPINAIVPGIEVDGPVPELAALMRPLYLRAFGRPSVS